VVARLEALLVPPERVLLALLAQQVVQVLVVQAHHHQVVLELAQSMGIMPVVRQVELGELFRADEAFLTNSVLEIMPLTRIDDKPIGSGGPGPLTQRLMSAYKKLVAKET